MFLFCCSMGFPHINSVLSPPPSPLPDGNVSASMHEVSSSAKGSAAAWAILPVCEYWSSLLLCSSVAYSGQPLAQIVLDSTQSTHNLS